MSGSFRYGFLCLGGCFLAGCARVAPQADYLKAQEYSARSTGQERLFNPDQIEAGAEYIRASLSDGLTADEAAC